MCSGSLQHNSTVNEVGTLRRINDRFSWIIAVINLSLNTWIDKTTVSFNAKLIFVDDYCHKNLIMIKIIFRKDRVLAHERVRLSADDTD